jgi:hypothetical protein
MTHSLIRRLALDQPSLHSKLIQDTKNVSRFKTLRSVYFFAEVIVNLGAGARAFIEAEGLEVLLHIHSANPLVFVNQHGTTSNLSVWNDAIRVLSREEEAVSHCLLTALRDTMSIVPRLLPDMPGVSPTLQMDNDGDIPESSDSKGKHHVCISVYVRIYEIHDLAGIFKGV